MKQNKKKILTILMCTLLLTGCTKQLKDDDNKVITNEKTGQSITENIICKPTDKDVIKIYKDNDVYVVTGEKIEKLLKMTKFTDEGARRFANKLRKMGVDDRLREMGIQEGDYVRILDYEFEFRE